MTQGRQRHGGAPAGDGANVPMTQDAADVPEVDPTDGGAPDAQTGGRGHTADGAAIMSA